MKISCFKFDPKTNDTSCEQKRCYIIDDFGYIFLSGDESELGKHISAVDGPLFQSLTGKKIFTEYRISDFQGSCDHAQKDNSGKDYPVFNKQTDDLIKEYNSRRPCIKESSLYKIRRDKTVAKTWDENLITTCYFNNLNTSTLVNTNNWILKRRWYFYHGETICVFYSILKLIKICDAKDTFT